MPEAATFLGVVARLKQAASEGRRFNVHYLISVRHISLYNDGRHFVGRRRPMRLK